MFLTRRDRRKRRTSNEVKTTGRILEVPQGHGLLGRVVRAIAMRATGGFLKLLAGLWKPIAIGVVALGALVAKLLGRKKAATQHAE